MILSIFDQCVRDLESNGGYAILPLTELQLQSSSTNVVPNAFDSARSALDEIKGSGVNSDGSINCSFMPLIDPSTDSGGWTGYHRANVSCGRYNQHREGFVFSNGEFPSVMNTKNDFESDMKHFFHFCHDIVANGVLRAIERRLDLPNSYFDVELGPTNNASQWHLKRYQVELQVEDRSKEDETLAQQQVLLPMHTDPSLISVVIIDSPGLNEGGKGLEVFHTNCFEGKVPKDCKTKKRSGTWQTISHHGHDVAVIFVGSVLSYLTKGQMFPAIKHRVVNDCKTDVNNRMAATLFVRPHPDAYLKTLPSKYIEHEGMLTSKLPPTFRVWNARVAKNYMKKKKKKKQQQQREQEEK